MHAGFPQMLRVFSGLLFLACIVWLRDDKAQAATFNQPPPASLSLTSAPGGMRVVYTGSTNFKYQVHVSSNLTAWSLLASNVATNGATVIIDTLSTNRPMRFYKASSLVTPFFYQGTFSGSERGAFILLARTNASVVFMAVTTNRNRGEYATNVVVAGDDSACGTFIVGAPGCYQFTTSNTLTGRFTNSSSATGTLTGVQKANLGSYSGYAGLYSGNVLAPHPGPARILLCPDGSYAFYRTDQSTGTKDGGVAVDRLPAVGPATVDVYLSNSGIMHVQGEFNKFTKVFNLQIHELDNTLSIASLTFSEPVF
jgi:hypothetical protein